jgi:hypothetical protein
LDTSAANELASVTVRYEMHNDTDNVVHSSLYFHDYDSNDYVQCDYEQVFDVSGYTSIGLTNSCSGYSSSWAADVELEFYDVGSDMAAVTLTMFSVYK